MKKALLLLALALGIHGHLLAQTCTPDPSITEPGAYPSQLPNGIAGQYYENTIQFNIPEDTVVEFGGNQVTAEIDSIKVLSVQGLPTGLTYNCTPVSCALPGGQTSCGLVFGTIDLQAAGYYPFVIPIRIYARINGFLPVQQNDTIFSLEMTVDQANSLSKSTFGAVSVFPNPAENRIQAGFPTSTSSMEVETHDALGRKVALAWDKTDNRLSADVQSLTSGVYVVTCIKNGQVHQFRFIRR